MQRNLEEQGFRAVRRETGVTRVSVRARDLVDQSMSTDKRLRANFPPETESYPQFFFLKEVGKIFLLSATRHFTTKTSTSNKNKE